MASSDTAAPGVADDGGGGKLQSGRSKRIWDRGSTRVDGFEATGSLAQYGGHQQTSVLRSRLMLIVDGVNLGWLVFVLPYSVSPVIQSIRCRSKVWVDSALHRVTPSTRLALVH